MKNILVAEDDQFLAEMIRLALEEHDVEVRMARDGEEAVKAIEDRHPDLLLLDLIMPKKDGLHVLTHIKDKGYTFPVVILSNLSGETVSAQYFSLGIRDYLIKSNLDEDDLWKKIKRYL